ncbi:hypothetical protein [Dongia sp.]|uniref:hypothetical protein n=1 Tax=Dongia sp. TaxID=1977262 RepID=UPI0035B18D4E
MRRQFRSVLNWLKRPSVLLAVIGLVLPNIAFVALNLAGVGVPPRTLPIILYMLAAASIRFLPSPLVVIFFIAALAFDVIYCATQLFGLTLTEALFALRFINELDILQSTLYVVLIVLLSSVFGSAFYLLVRFARQLKGARWTLMLALGLLTIPADILLNTPKDSNFWLRIGGTDRPFESAITKSGFIQLVEQPNGRPMLVMIVEAMGHFDDPAMQKLLEDAIRSHGIEGRYDVTTGTNSFIGGTTSAEMREFCQTRDSYMDHLDKPRPDCLPFHLEKMGYHTVAYHGFSQGMFERGKWWPQIGFTERHFGEDLFHPGERLCGDVFVGVCDPKLVKDIAARLKAATEKEFAYLLTFNTHVPVIGSQGYNHLDCQHHDPRLPEREVCFMADAWIELLQTVAATYADPAQPPAEILIVGDHAPPLWYRKARDLFTPGEVTWFRLSPKN